MLVDISKANVFTPADPAQPTYPNVRFIFRSGVAAVWREDPVTRFARVEGVHFAKRHRADEPHILTFADGTEWRIFPLGGGGCGCTSALKGFSHAQLLAPDPA